MTQPISQVPLDYGFRLAFDERSDTSESGSTHRGQKIVFAYFRDKATAEAAATAPAIVRLFLEEVGVRFKPSQQYEIESISACQLVNLQRQFVQQITLSLSNKAMKRALVRAKANSAFDVMHFVRAAVQKQNDNSPVEEPQQIVVPRRVTGFH